MANMHGDNSTHFRVVESCSWNKAKFDGVLWGSHSGGTWTHNLAGKVYPKKYAHGFIVLCFVVVMQSFIMNSYEVFIHIHQGCFAGTGATVRLPQCQRSKPDGYGKISQCITTTKHSKAKSVCIFLGIYCTYRVIYLLRCICMNSIFYPGSNPWLSNNHEKWVTI